MSTGMLLAASILACYRLTRLVAVDAIFDRQRQWLAKRSGRVSVKLSMLFTCPFCTGVHVAGWLTLALVLYDVSIPLPLLWWGAVAGAQSLCSAADAKLSSH